MRYRVAGYHYCEQPSTFFLHPRLKARAPSLTSFLDLREEGSKLRLRKVCINIALVSIRPALRRKQDWGTYLIHPSHTLLPLSP